MLNSLIGKIEFKNPKINYGNQNDWVLSTNYFHFINKSKKPIYILRADKPDGCKLIFPSVAIMPGKAGKIGILFTPKNTGVFSYKIRLYHSGSKAPSILKIKGSSKSIPNTNNIDCPTFEKNAAEKKLNNTHSGLVKNKVYGHPVKNAQILFIQNNQIIENLKTDKSGGFEKELRLGLYSIFVTAKGYDTIFYDNFYVNHYTDPFIFELTQKQRKTPDNTIKENNITSELIEEDTPTTDTVSMDIIITKTPETDLHLPDNILIDSNVKKHTPNPKIDTQIKEPETKDLLDKKLYHPNNLVFLIDVSKSMKDSSQLPWVKANIIEMISQLRSIDKISLITYANGVQILTYGAPCSDKKNLFEIIDTIKTRGSTRGEEGIKKAYKLAKKLYIPKGNNQIIIATDGGFNGLGESRTSLFDFIQKNHKKGIRLSVLGVGNKAKGKHLMRNLAYYGKGNYCHIHNNDKLSSVLIDEIKKQSYKH